MHGAMVCLQQTQGMLRTTVANLVTPGRAPAGPPENEVNKVSIFVVKLSAVRGKGQQPLFAHEQCLLVAIVGYINH